MNLTKTRDRILAAVGGAALLIYILACAGSSFSPDDSKVLYPSNDPTTGHFALALYDRKTRKSHALFAIPDDDVLLTATAWTGDGSRAVAIWTSGEKELDIASIPLGTGRPIRLFRIPDSESDVGMQFAHWPAPVVGSSLFIATDKAIHRLDLEDGREASVAVDGSPVLFGLKGHVYYARGMDKKALEDPSQMEFGIVDLGTLSLSPLYTMPWGDNRGFFALSQDGKKLAVAVGPEGVSDIGVIKFDIYENGQLRRSIPLGPDARALGEFMDFIWSGDSRKLYFGYQKDLDGNRAQYGVAELTIGDGALRSLPLLTTTEKSGEGSFGLIVGLSHDGRTLAVASTYLQTARNKLDAGQEQRLQAKDLALYLIDVASPDWKVTKVPIPPLPMPVAQPAATKSP